MTDEPQPRVPPVLPTLASAGYERRRHGALRVALWDTDYLLNQVRASTAPLTSVRAGFSGVQLRQYASHHVLTELYRDDGHGHPTKWHKLSEQHEASSAPAPPDIFRAAFETKFLPGISFVEMGDLFADHPLALAVGAVRNGKGASDIPTAQLAVLLSRLRPVAYSHDEHLYKSRVAPRPANLRSVQNAEHYVAQGEHVQLGAAGLSAAAIAGIDFLARAVGSRLGSPDWLARLLYLGVGTAALSSRTRREAVGQLLLPIGEFVLEQVERGHEALAHLDEHAVDVAPSDAVEARIAEVMVLRTSEGPLLAREIQDAVASCDSDLDTIPSLHELRVVLERSQCFIEGPRWRYSLGRR
ncbi:hypothetical protein [Allobranchiibius sp. CTAmp26]|uniref:hypothetical protein n=1 Tax=Allobranchiibius sp. CTAmp26 TaxID=2815214 RepID=UPI001AA177D3|nr:hypothetical protein [Allobranchiibius sp. CTAmp26]MBO1754830.1 hypothetical protein [Allobranchiibius sp. CTAmp26]